jgi:hypothetical protein
MQRSQLEHLIRAAADAVFNRALLKADIVSTDAAVARAQALASPDAWIRRLGLTV